MNPVELAAIVLGPHFDAVRDTFAAFEPDPGMRLAKLERTTFLVDPKVRNSERHFAACSEDGRTILLAPELSEQDLDTVVAILSHEFGHAADFSYPSMWFGERGKPAVWLGDLTKAKLAEERERGREWARLWAERPADAVEWTADSIAHAVIGRPIGYCGPQLVQCFGGVHRPAGLR